LVSRASTPNFSPNSYRRIDLAPKHKQTQFQAQMTTAIDDLAKKFDGFDAALTKVLDKLTALEAWKSSASTLMETLLSQSERTASRIDNLESAPTLSMAPHPPPRPTTAPPQPPSRRTDPFDLNTAPQQEMRPPASA